ncbi:MAG: hypothetical protein IPL71_04735 [Anaerolineales bacterium]|uniref:hypothetical protein n=1 Tax=Candidatus Villigracilis proximus TaxID=3140683 RepID=UPI003134B443|nr:hypothetical protein [Anaerolineales bacterium]
MKHIYQIFSPLILILLLGTSCQSTPHTAQKIELANVLENKVQVSITLEKDQSGQPILSATFTPQDPNLHLYSKDIPKRKRITANPKHTAARTTYLSRRRNHTQPPHPSARRKQLDPRRSHRQLHGL